MDEEIIVLAMMWLNITVACFITLTSLRQNFLSKLVKRAAAHMKIYTE